MNPRVLFGERESFGIEYSKANSRNYIHVQLWLGGQWVGDIQDSIMPEHMCAELLRLACPVHYPKYAYDLTQNSPSYEEMLTLCGSFGESFDPFVLSYCSSSTFEKNCFKWRLHESYYYLFPDYPRQLFQYFVDYSIYNSVVRQFLLTMIDEGYYLSDSTIPTLAELDCYKTLTVFLN